MLYVESDLTHTHTHIHTLTFRLGFRWCESCGCVAEEQPRDRTAQRARQKIAVHRCVPDVEVLCPSCCKCSLFYPELPGEEKEKEKFIFRDFLLFLVGGLKRIKLQAKLKSWQPCLYIWLAAGFHLELRKFSGTGRRTAGPEFSEVC